APTQHVRSEVKHRIVFHRLFGEGTSAEQRRRHRKRNASILDAVVGQLASFKQDLGAGDRARIDTYVENIRELERRIRIAMEHSINEPTADVPFGLPDSKHVNF